MELKHVSIIYFLFLLLLKFRYSNMLQWKIIIRFNIFNLMCWSLCWMYTRAVHLNPHAGKRCKTFPSSKNVPDKNYKLIFCGQLNAKESKSEWNDEIKSKSDTCIILSTLNLILGFHMHITVKWLPKIPSFQPNGLVEMNHLSKCLIDAILRILSSRIFFAGCIRIF